MTTSKDIEKLKKDVFNTLYEIDTRERSVEKDTGRTKLNYLPWATTYSEVCKNFEDIDYVFVTNTEEKTTKKILKIDDNTTLEEITTVTQEIPYTVTPAGLFVSTKVTVNGITKEMSLPVYDSSFKSMGLEPYEYSTKSGKKTVPAATMADIYKSIMRCFAKNLSMFGVGLNYWTKEDAPESVLKIEKLITEIDNAYVMKKKKGFTDDEIIGVYKSLLPEDLEGNYKLCDNEEILNDVKKKILNIRTSTVNKKEK